MQGSRSDVRQAALESFGVDVDGPEEPLFECPVECKYPDPYQAYSCLNSVEHPLEGQHLIGSSHDGLHVREWGDPWLRVAP